MRRLIHGMDTTAVYVARGTRIADVYIQRLDAGADVEYCELLDAGEWRLRLPKDATDYYVSMAFDPTVSVEQWEAWQAEDAAASEPQRVVA